jgi:hypothetical protein
MVDLLLATNDQRITRSACLAGRKREVGDLRVHLTGCDGDTSGNHVLASDTTTYW